MELNDNTNLITKCKIIVEFAYQESANPEWSEWFEQNDLGVPLALLYSNDMVEFKPMGIVIVQETWLALCRTTMANPTGTYKSLDDMLLNFEPSLGDEDEDE